jgi:uncharacterized protein
MQSPHLTVIIKVTHRCNLRCTYCGQYRQSKDIIPFRVVAHTISKVFQQPDLESVTFVWHGGEPLFAGQDFFKKALFLEEKCNSRGIAISNSLQTNGTMLTDEWAKYLKEAGFNVGLSIDGPKELHNKHRRYLNNKNSFSKVLDALRLLQNHGIPYGVLSVVNKDTLEVGSKKMFEFMLENKIKTFSFLQERPNYISSQGAINPAITLRDFNKFVAEVFDLWYNKDDPDLHVREFSSILQTFFGGQSNVCIYGGDCFGNIVCIDTDGAVYHCDRYMDDEEYKLGNILVNDFSEIRGSAKVKKLQLQNTQRVTEHKKCKWLTTCRGGCPFYSLLNDATCTNQEETCANASLIKHIYERVKTELSSVSNQKDNCS